MDARIDEVQADWAMCRKAAVGGTTTSREVPRVEVPKPKPFDGKRDAREVDNFVWHMERYFEVMALEDEATKVRTTTLYLTDTATLWWRRRHADIERGWAAQELQRRGVQDLASAIAAAESLVEFRREDNAKAKKSNGENGGGEKGPKKYPPKEGSSKATTSKEGKAKFDKKDKFTPRDKCFLCDGPHWARDCPKRKALNALLEKGEEEAHVGSLQQLGAIKAKATEVKATTSQKGLMYVEVHINGKPSRAMIDTGATHNFVSMEEAKKLGLKVSKEGGWLKAVNSQARPIECVARGVEMSIGTWKGTVNLSVVPMDDFQVVLGMEFLRRVKAIPMPFISTVCIMEEGAPCMVPTVQGTKEGPKLLSAMQLEKGVKKGEDTYLATLLEEKENSPTEVLPNLVEKVLEEFKDVMPTELPKRLPPRRKVAHAIELEPGAKPPAIAPYRMSPSELEELRKQLKDLLDAGLGGARYFTKLDLRSGYYQVRIAEGDEAKTTCVTRYGSYEFLVMPFGLTNAPATFCTLMNKVFHPYLDKFVVVYLDNIVVYSHTLEEHVQHLRIVFEVLKDNQLYVKKEKCSFAQEEVMFLGHKIGGGTLRMDKSKVRAIQEWEAPTKVIELRSFLGLVNYYRRFIQGYSKRAAPLTDLLKKNKAWEWSDSCQDAFDDLKEAIMEEPVLALPDYGKPFEVHTDASDFTIGGVLMQERHPIAYESRKLNDTERRYTIHETEMTAVVHCLRTWRHSLLGSRFVVKTNNVATSYFQTQKKLSPKQARWQDFLVEFDFVFEYKPGKTNEMADALSRKPELASLSQPEGELVGLIKEGLQHDPVAKSLLALAKEGKTRRF
ncbi:uncharacterized protein LOC122651025 [Telopea speciosissima]|uniref:uncharacterized protein LOC122651025 n=1 Tax=Telopea speciosissima TaxID=54955 RepID=UPI001CC5E7DC|nr:uncharacterized protein LOC122651025 [Telopea speciosissima]